MSSRSRLTDVLLLTILGLLVSACAFVMPAPVKPTSRPSPPATPVESTRHPADVPERPQKGFRAPDFKLADLEGKNAPCSFFYQGTLPALR